MYKYKFSSPFEEGNKKKREKQFSLQWIQTINKNRNATTGKNFNSLSLGTRNYEVIPQCEICVQSIIIYPFAHRTY